MINFNKEILPKIAEGEDKTSLLANCIRNNYRHLRKWAKRTNTDCFRLYDRDILRYPVSIDFYAGRYNVNYFGKGDHEEPPEGLVDEVKEALQRILAAPLESIYFRTRARTKLTRQYEKKANSKEFFSVVEYDVKFHINLTDYLDTGLFLDHRETRQLVAKESKGKRLLNLFAYTCSFSVHAAIHGATYTKSVDMSNTYTDWGRANFMLNQIPLKNHDIVRADCLKFLMQERETYDVIVIDPPTISRSKKMDGLFDIQKDYPFLIEKALHLLAPDGVIFFSTNARKFAFNPDLPCTIQEITNKTLPIDFRDAKIHRCWKIKKSLV